MRTQIGLGPQVTPTERSLTRDLIYKQRKTNEKKEKKIRETSYVVITTGDQCCWWRRD